MGKRADFIIIGAMKCATSTLRLQLARQAGFFMCAEEPNFFSNDDRYSRGIEWYENLFEGAPAGCLCGESSTHYTKLPTYPHTVERMYGDMPDIRLIYIMRHPIDRLVSQYIHEWTERNIDVPINVAIDRHPELISYSCYAMQIEPYLSTYGSRHVLPVFFDGLRTEPQAELERVCRFLGYEGEVKWAHERPQNVSSERMRKSALRDAIVEFPPLAMVRRRFVPKAIRNRVRDLWTLRQRPEISEANQRRLVQVFDEDLKRLGEWIGQDISCANFRQVTAGESRPVAWKKEELPA